MFANPDEFRTAFLSRLVELARTDSNIVRYRRAVEGADARALWELGVDTHAFSAVQTPGDALTGTQRVAYFYNPSNLSAASLSWLDRSALKRFRLPGASHWICFDQPEAIADRIIEAMAGCLIPEAAAPLKSRLPLRNRT